MGPHSVTYHPTQVNMHPALTPARQACTPFVYFGEMEDWADLGDWSLIQVLIRQRMARNQTHDLLITSPMP